MYADSSLEVNDKILEHIANQDIYLTAEKFKEHREHPVHTFEVLVSWEGLADIEDSWEPVKIMNEDVPVTLLEYVRSSDDAKLSRFIHRLQSPRVGHRDGDTTVVGDGAVRTQKTSNRSATTQRAVAQDRQRFRGRPKRSAATRKRT
ncbi:hypothetical protein PC114_g25073 [Phytophthora cactorum]|nr:hypothetical protein PC114_g25073 [Phytophthora cactorum]